MTGVPGDVSESPDQQPAQAKHLAHTWDEARKAAFDVATPIPPGRVSLTQALGRVLAEDITALHDMPHYASSAMDGWAVNGSGPWIVADAGVRLEPHQASPIVTGGLIPPGAKAVLRSESALLGTDDDGLPLLMTGGTARPGEPGNGQHIRKAGEEAAAGEVLVKAGLTLNPAHLAVAALAGHDDLLVQGKPVVKLLLTGAEVVAQGLPVPGQVRDTFGPQLAAVVEMLGGINGGQERIGDSYTEWLDGLADLPPEVPDPAALPADVVITTGGTGRSDTDHLRRAVAELGGRLVIDGIAMRPGHPAVLAELPDGRFVLGLPGNPLAAMMALSTVGEPLLAALGHGTMPPVQEVPCGTTIEPEPGRTRLVPFRLLYGMASPAKHTGPGMMRGLASAHGVMVVPPHGVQLGEPVPAFALPWGPPVPVPEQPGAKPKGRPAAKAATRATGKDPAKPAGPVDWSALLG
ncbi:MAG TPA: molybdopterin molybdenumtransferase MoeA [Arthrobacter bacterium]|nr:molybdopterin molybdenumtransferase MoeA [Arthrobacter sp.]HBH59015.1 molybdopterin molybdenumtransferase MoeA [Arthrobacter sp.]HCB58015.1 molybdopterin molybdenumtransferase MoeA [Arthrobacter sp.]HCC40008.1 molybdopterin molybdenumtransferase MoeA [Arthrobacter sp.]HCN21601.1 molybdopterin molybdenumtransferase MoeA [Arthrobacter sp.]